MDEIVQKLTLEALALQVHLILRDRKEEMSRQLRSDLRAMFDEHLSEHLPENIREQYLAEVVDAMHEGVGT
jgi:hypothetical protein